MRQQKPGAEGKTKQQPQIATGYSHKSRNNSQEWQVLPTSLGLDWPRQGSILDICIFAFLVLAMSTDLIVLEVATVGGFVSPGEAALVGVSEDSAASFTDSGAGIRSPAGGRANKRGKGASSDWLWSDPSVRYP